jgi:alpha-ketoglutarate-dependent taurine dioxygenase
MTTQKQVEIIKVAGRIGAEIRGVTLSADLEPAVLEEVKAALKEHKVVFFKDQHHLDDRLHEAFAKKIDELYAHPTVPAKENSAAIFELDSEHGGKANQWHTDVTFVPEVPKYSILRGVTLPSVGGDTVWANTNTAYEDLPEGLQKLAESTWAIHSNKFDYVETAYRKVANKVFTATIYETRHPIVHIHAETGKKHLLLGSFVRQFEGYTTSESEVLLNIFQAYITRLENTVRWQWNEGDVAIWDNLATQHYAVSDYEEKRVVRRITVGKNIPVSSSDESSTLLIKK